MREGIFLLRGKRRIEQKRRRQHQTKETQCLCRMLMVLLKQGFCGMLRGARRTGLSADEL